MQLLFNDSFRTCRNPLLKNRAVTPGKREEKKKVKTQDFLQSLQVLHCMVVFFGSVSLLLCLLFTGLGR